jgi:hypothetical protein
MADIAIGKALWNDLVCQIAARARDHDAAADLPRTANPKSVRYQAQTSADNATAFQVRTAASADAGNHRYSRVFKSAAIAQRFESSGRFQDEIVGRRRIRSDEKDLGKCGRSSRDYALMRSVVAAQRKKGVFQIIQTN